LHRRDVHVRAPTMRRPFCRMVARCARATSDVERPRPAPRRIRRRARADDCKS
jgi:hypothetical protein